MKKIAGVLLVLIVTVFGIYYFKSKTPSAPVTQQGEIANISGNKIQCLLPVPGSETGTCNDLIISSSTKFLDVNNNSINLSNLLPGFVVKATGELNKSNNNYYLTPSEIKIISEPAIFVYPFPPEYYTAGNTGLSSPLKISGYINGNGWAGFEGQVGTVELVDDSGKQLSRVVLQATSEWTTLPTFFSASLDFISNQDTSAKLIFHNENPSGLSEKNKEFQLAIRINKTGETILVKTFFGNNNLDPQITCSKVFPVERIITKTQATARAAIEELLKGLTDSEKSQGFFTSINPGVKIQQLTIQNGIAKVDFDETLEKAVGGSCRVSAIRAQITQTLLQFPTVKSVIISINGRTEDILQP